MSAIPRSSNKAIHDALRVLAREIQSEDGVANVAIAEGADRISELGNEVERLERENAALRADKERLDWLGEKCHGASNSERYLPRRVYWKQTTIRAAIDAARAKENQS